MAGSSRRTNLQGHTIVATPEQLTQFRRLSTETIRSVFQQAKEQGQAPILLGDESLVIVRRSDHTFYLRSTEPRGWL